MRPAHLLLAPLVLACFAAPLIAAEPENPQIDYDGYTELTLSLDEVRDAHRLSYGEFIARAQAEGALLLDARSETAFAMGHIEGAVNLPLPDFTDERLAEVLGADKDRPIYIYCNNNFVDDRPPVVTKRAPLALNIATFINLHGYGYTNVWELAGVIATDDPGVEWVGSEVAFNQ
jgi:phage shock protein E